MERKITILIRTSYSRAKEYRSPAKCNSYCQLAVTLEEDEPELRETANNCVKIDTKHTQTKWIALQRQKQPTTVTHL